MCWLKHSVDNFSNNDSANSSGKQASQPKRLLERDKFSKWAFSENSYLIVWVRIFCSKSQAVLYIILSFYFFICQCLLDVFHFMLVSWEFGIWMLVFFTLVHLSPDARGFCASVWTSRVTCLLWGATKQILLSIIIAAHLCLCGVRFVRH